MPTRQLTRGDQVPNFTLNDEDENPWELQEALERGPLVVFFYPKDNTLVCTKEACSFRDAHASFEGLGVEVVGISGDGAASHQAFKAKHRLQYKLLSDTHGEARRLFGVKKTLGLFDERITFVVGSDGRVLTAFSSAMNAKKHVQEALAAAKQTSPE